MSDRSGGGSRARARQHRDAAVALREIAEILERYDQHHQARECCRQANELAEYYEELGGPIIAISTDPPHEGKLVGEFHD